MLVRTQTSIDKPASQNCLSNQLGLERVRHRLTPQSCLTKCQIFEKETLMRAKGPSQRYAADVEEPNDGLSYTRTVVETSSAMLFLPRQAGILANYQ